jgi:hypothetical protein
MKKVFVAAAFMFVTISYSCTQRTCPTYTKGIEKQQKEATALQQTIGQERI